jgi:uncharacterized protein (DUF849 family)
MRNKVIITCAVTGSIPTREKHPGLPVAPKEIAESALEAHQAGAAICHIHVREPETGLPSMRYELYEEVFHRIRERSEMLINLTTGAGGRISIDKEGQCDTSRFRTPAERLSHVVRLRPEVCSLDVGTLNFGEFIFANPVSNVEVMAAEIQAAGVKPELEVFDVGHISIAKHLIAKGLIDPPPLFQLCTGIAWGIPATVRNFVAMYENLPEGAVFAGFGIGATEFPMVTQCLLLGGHLRVGFEDNLYLSKGVLAKSNAELVEKAVNIAHFLGKEIASVGEARRILGLGR